MSRIKAAEILDLYLFENIDNNYNQYEDTHDITWVGNNFAVLEITTGVIHTFKVVFTDTDLPENRWQEAFNEQGWNE
jgi:hypothetical protein